MQLLLAARLSRKHRSGDQGVGIETQDQRGREWAEHEGHEVIDVAADTRSGTVAPQDRKNLKPWMTDPALMARYDGILAYKNDRLSRGCWADEVRIRLWAEENGKTLVIVDGPQWPPRHAGDKWSWEAMADSARREWEAIQERNMRMQAHRRESGFLVGDAPFGYIIVCSEKCGKSGQDCPHGKLLEKDPETAPYALQMALRYIDGHSLPDLCRWLDDEGVKPRHGGKWWPTGVRTILANEALIGVRRHKGGKVVLRFEPILDPDAWAKLQDRLNGNPRRCHASAPGLITGLIYCGLCGRKMSRKSVYTLRKDGSKKYLDYYQCNGDARSRSTCRNMIRMDFADESMDSFVTDVLGRAKLIERSHVSGHGHEDEIAETEAEMDRLDKSAPGYIAKVTELHLRLTDLRNAKPAPAEPKERDTGLTIGVYWDGLADLRAKRNFLAAGKVKVLAVAELRKRKGTEPRPLQFSVTALIGGDWTWRLVRYGVQSLRCSGVVT